MRTISASVGRGGMNRRRDVETVQSFINENIGFLTPLAPLRVDGIAGTGTIIAIEEFQRRVLHMLKPTGCVDPGDATFKKLAEAVPPERPTHVNAFINRVLPAARKVKVRWRVPVSVLIAQAALESGWGTSVKDNAYFGIKGKSPKGLSTTFTTTEYTAGQKVTTTDQFRAYKDFDEAADDYGAFLNQNPRYANCFAFTNSPEGFIDALAAAGYATDPKYATKLKSIITTYQLQMYDR